MGTLREGRVEPSVEEDRICREVVDAAFKVHKCLGPGLLETVYERCLAYELQRRGIAFRSQISMTIEYEGLRLESELRLDLLVEEKVVVELKSVERSRPLHVAQILTYLKLANARVGLLINFNVPLIRDGIRRVVRSP